MESSVKFIFNPEHDLCLASGDVNFIPPAAAVRFAQQGKWIEKFMRAPQGVQGCGGAADSSARMAGDIASCISGNAVGNIVPWGWNAVLKRKLIDEGCPLGVLPSDEEVEFIRENSRRELAVELLDRLQELQFPEPQNISEVTETTAASAQIIPSTYRIIAKSLEEIELFLSRIKRVVLKAPLSGSGKGIRFVTGELMETDRGWCRKTLQKQGAVIVEQRMEVQQEFAMLFECTPAAERPYGNVIFRGYSMFYARNGAYKGNILASNEHIENTLTQWIPKGMLYKVQEEIAQWLDEKLSGKYTGFIGVDQFICPHNGTILYNPAMEINLRMTMGLIARNIYDYHKEEYALGEGTHCFEPERGIILLPCSGSPQTLL